MPGGVETSGLMAPLGPVRWMLTVNGNNEHQYKNYKKMRVDSMCVDSHIRFSSRGFSGGGNAPPLPEGLVDSP